MGKLSLAVLGVTGGGGGGGGAVIAEGYSIYSAIQPRTIEEKLLKEGFKLVSNIEDSSEADKEWSKILERYKVEVDDNSKIISRNTMDVKRNDISDWCKDNLRKKIQDSLYSKASKWCVTFTSMEEKLSQGSKRLQTNAETLQTKYSSIPSNLQVEINKVTVTSGSHQNGEKVKVWCSNLSKRAFANERDTYYQSLLSYCI